MTVIPVPSIYERKRIPQKAIDDVARQIVEKFRPQKIILLARMRAAIRDLGVMWTCWS